MVASKKKMFFKVGVFLLVMLVMVVCGGSPTFALITSRYNLYSQNDIYFYDPDVKDCIPRDEEGDGGGDKYDGGEEKWDGVSCTPVSSQREEWLKKYETYIRSVAKKNQLPWEMIAAQAFMESGGGVHEACKFNPLGLKGSPSCDSSRHRSFNSYEEAFQYYANMTLSVKEVKGKYPDDPYSAVAYIQYGVQHGKSYAQCSKQSYLTDPSHPCYGHKLGDPTRGYVKNVSSLICGIQKWARANNIPISKTTWKNYIPDDGLIEFYDDSEEEEEDEEDGVEYCQSDDDVEDESNDDDGYLQPEAGNLASYVKAWAWPDYHSKPYLEKMPAYAKYMSQSGIEYKGDCGGVDCGAFVANIIKASGWDTSYPQGSTSEQKKWLPSHWNKVADISSLKLGDVGVKKTGHHVILYVGNISGFNSKTASASQCDRAPMAGSPNEDLNNYTWYRKK